MRKEAMTTKRLSRRHLLAVGAPTLAGLVAACGAATPTAVPPKPTEAPKPAAAAPTTAPAAKPAEPTKPAAASAATTAPAAATKPAAASAATTAPAVAKPAAGVPGPAKLTWWSFSFGQPGAKAMNEDILPAYMKQFPNVQVTYEWVDVTKAGERELAAFAAGTMADVWEPYSEALPDIQRTNRGVPLDAYLASSKLIAKDDFSQGTWNHHFIGGKLWAIPYRLDIRGWLYRKSHLDARNIPVPTELTWEKNLQLAKDLTVREGNKLVRAGHSPWETPIRMVQQWVEALWQTGGEVLSQDLSKATFATPEGERALQHVIDLHKAVYPNPEAGLEQSPVPYFPAGKVSQYWRNPTARGEMMQYAKDDYKDVVLAPVPARGPSGKDVALMFASSWALSPRGQAKNPDAAWHALEWVAGNPEQVEKFLLSGGFLPCSKKVAARPVFKEDHLFAGFDQIQAKYGRQMTPWPRTLELYNILGDDLTAVYFGKKQAKAALENSQKVWNELIPKAG
jgi:multiple sugar transport system substrate-binding protein